MSIDTSADASPRLKNGNPRWQRIAVVAIISIHVALVSWGAWRHSPTMDEPAYLAAGVSHWEFGRFDLCQVSPPLVRLIAGGAVKLANPKVNWENYKIAPGVRFEHAVGRDFMIANGPRSFWLFTLGRWACLPFTILGAYVSFRWARELFGLRSAFVALLLWCFSPNILAHAQQLTPDIGVTSLALTACYLCYKWARRPSSWRAAIAGLTLGFAMSAKTNAVILVPVLAIAVSINSLWAPHLRHLRTLAQLCVLLLSCLYSLNLVYRFEGTFRQLSEYQFFSETFRAAASHDWVRDKWLQRVPVPLPASFVEGIDLQRRDFENSDGSAKTYFRGNWYDKSWWWYYGYASLVKMPAGTLLLLIAGVATVVMRPLSELREVGLYVLLPGIALFAFASSQTGFGHSFRYVLPAVAFIILICSNMAAVGTGAGMTHCVSGLVCYSLVSSLAVFPHSLSYFNEPSGGSLNGDFHLLDGNLEWGQDMLFVHEWIASHENCQPVQAAVWSWHPHDELGLNLGQPNSEHPIRPAELWIISVNLLRNEFRGPTTHLKSFLKEPLIDRIGYTKRVYQYTRRTETLGRERIP